MHSRLKNFNIGDKITIELMNNYDKQKYVSQIIETRDDSTLDIVIPIYKNRIIYIKNDTELEVVVSKGEAIYEFKAKILNKVFGRIPLLKLELISKITKIQRRDYFRLKYIHNITIKKVTNLKEKVFDEEVTGSMIDISGGGLAFTSNIQFEEKDVVEISMNINNTNVVILGKIVRKSLSGNGSVKYSYGVQFSNITEIQRNEIMKFIFEEQRKLAKKGLI